MMIMTMMMTILMTMVMMTTASGGGVCGFAYDTPNNDKGDDGIQILQKRSPRA